MNKKNNQTTSNERLYSLDALRGFDMFWITGGGLLSILLTQDTGFDWLANQMHHVKWEGFRFHDLIFPLFMFIAGVAIPFAIISKLEKGVPKKELVKKVTKRMLILVGLGIIYNGVLKNGFADARYASVLGQIGLSYFFAALIVIYTKSFKSRLIWIVGILVGYAALQLAIPVPGHGAGILTPEGCMNGYIDRFFLPGKLHGGTYDPEGLLCIISATGITLMGSVAGYFLRKKDMGEWRKTAILSIIGAGIIIIGLAVSPVYPIIKKCWTSSFNLLAGGISFLLMAFFYMVIDVLKWRKWSFFFRVIGMNSIFIYLFVRFIDINYTFNFLFGWTSVSFGEYSKIALQIGGILLLWSLLYYMYKKKIFLRV